MSGADPAAVEAAAQAATQDGAKRQADHSGLGDAVETTVDALDLAATMADGVASVAGVVVEGVAAAGGAVVEGIGAVLGGLLDA